MAGTRVTRVLGPSERWDTGTVVLAVGGRLAARLVRVPGPDPAQPATAIATAEFRSLEDGTVVRLEFEQASARSRPVAPGAYSLVLGGAAADLAPAREVVIVAGEETSVTLEIKPPR